MNPTQLLAHFDRISDTPEAIPRLRNFILDLAVRGKLVEQDPAEEPASELLKKIRVEKVRLVREGIIKKHEALPPFDRAACPFPVPAGWEWERFIEVAAIQSNLVNPKDYRDSPHIAPDNIESGTGRLLPYQTIGASAVFSSKHLFSSGCILYSKIRPALAKAVTVDFAGLCSADMYPLLPFVCREYLHKYMLTEAFVRQSVSEDNRVAMPKINQASLSKILVVVPPLAEQHRIVSKVDELMALCDRLEAAQAERESRRDRLAAASLHRLNQPANTDAPEVFREHARFYFNHLPRLTTRPEQIKQLRQTILNLAVRGRLVPQDPTDEPASELLRSMEACKESLLGQATKRRTKACRPLDENGVHHDVPPSWSWAMLGEITDVGTGSTPSRTQPSFWDEGSIPWITSGSTSQRLIIKGDEFVTEAAMKAHRLHLYRPGTLLVALYGQGKTRGQVATLGIESTINQACAAVCSLEGFEAVHAYLRLLFEKNYDEVRLLAAGGAQPNLNLQKIKEMPVPLPPLAEQRRIVAKVDELMSLCNRVETQLTTAQTENHRLLEAVLHETLAATTPETPWPPPCHPHVIPRRYTTEQADISKTRDA